MTVPPFPIFLMLPLFKRKPAPFAKAGIKEENMNGVQPEVIYEDNSVIAVRKPCNQPTAPDESEDVSL